MTLPRDDDTDCGVLVAAQATSHGQLADRSTESYFAEVEQILQFVFDVTYLDSREALRSLRDRWDEIDEAGRLVFFNISPLQVAADLGGAYGRPLTELEENRFKVLKSNGVVEPRGPIRWSIPHKKAG